LPSSLFEKIPGYVIKISRAIKMYRSRSDKALQKI